MRRLVFPAFYAFFITTLTACGEIEIPENTNTPEDTLIITDATVTADTDGQGDNPTDDSDKNSVEITSNLCAEEKQKLSEALELNTEALEQCEESRKSLAAKVETPSTKIPHEERYQKFVSYYLENKELAEFPFPKCGLINTFSAEPWFAGFSTALADAAITFGRRTIETTDLSGGCASSEGKMAFFLGAEDEVYSEFHLLRYDFESKKLEEAFFVNGPCEVCPSQLGKRFGSYLTLTGSTGANKVQFRYYYADNILQQE